MRGFMRSPIAWHRQLCIYLDAQTSKPSMSSDVVTDANAWMAEFMKRSRKVEG
jgi:hypothetical protein